MNEFDAYETMTLEQAQAELKELAAELVANDRRRTLDIVSYELSCVIERLDELGEN